MKEKVLALAKGNFTYEMPSLVLKPEKLDIAVTVGEQRIEKIQIENTRGTKLKGFGVVEEPGIEFLSVFDACKNVLELSIDASGFLAGEHYQGNIHFVTDCGEAELPYSISVAAPLLEDEKGVVSDYHILQERMKESLEDGAKLFYSKEFYDLFLFRDQAGRILYDHLTRENTKFHSMEEFLVAMGKKSALHFDVKHVASGSSKEVTYELMGTDIQDSVKLRINTWGSARIKVVSTADFIRPEMHYLEADEFEKDTDILEYTIAADKVPQGIRYGSLIFESPYEKHEIRICAHNTAGAKERKVERAKKAVFTTLFRMYLAYREERVTKEEFQNIIWNNRRIIQKIEHAYQTVIKGFIPAILRDEPSILAFYQETEGMEMPNAGAPLIEVENYILIQHMKFLYSNRDEDREQVSRLVMSYREIGYDSLLLFYIKLRTDSPFQEIQEKIQEIREQIYKGKNSPLLYSELLRLYIQDPTRISELDFVTVATINYGLKEDLITDDMAVVISFLSERAAKWEPVVFRMMTGIYEKFQSEDMLRAICSLLIRNEVQSSRYFKWFEKGIKAHLRITDLYEYYMYTMDRAATFSMPESVLSYFQYENHLSVNCKAFLYAYLIKKREQLPEYFYNYEMAVREFAISQLSHHSVSEDMGVIYETVFGADEIVDDVARKLPEVMFTELLTCYHPDMEGVLVVHVETLEEEYYPIVAGTAKIRIYTPNYQLYFKDKEGHYYCGSIEYRLQKLVHMEKYAGLCYQNGARYMPLMMYLAVTAERRVKISRQQAEIMFEVCTMDVLRDYAKGRFLLCLYDYFNKEKEPENVFAVLEAIRPEIMKRERLPEIASDCVYHGLYDKAEQIFSGYGISGCDKQALALLLKEKIREKEGNFVPLHVKWALWLYKERYFEWEIMNYLLKYYMGNTKTLTAIYRKCEEVSGHNVIEDGCKERLLGQVLFMGAGYKAYEKLFLDYYESGHNRVLVKAFLSCLAYEYLVERMELPEAVFVKIEKEAFYEKEQIMVLATLKYYSKMRDFAKKQRDFVELQLENCAGHGIVLPFMQDFTGKTTVPYRIENSVIAVHYSGTDKGVFLFLRNDGEENYESRPMKKIFDGIYIAEILLFSDEQKYGYVYEEETDMRFPEKLFRRAETKQISSGFYQMVNGMIEAVNTGNLSGYRELRTDYLEKHQVADKLFTIH